MADFLFLELQTEREKEINLKRGVEKKRYKGRKNQKLTEKVVCRKRKNNIRKNKNG
jgi:hypothetical protein